MGLFDRFKKGKEPKQETKSVEIPKMQDRVETRLTPDGRKVFEYHEARPDFKKGYDSTRIIVNKEPQIIEGRVLYDILVSWFGESDCVYLDPNMPSRGDIYEHIVAGIDPSLMESSPQYLEFVVKTFLEQRRVNVYKESSMMTEDELKEEYQRTGNTKRIPCGKYVGEVTIGENGRLGRRL